MKVIQKDVFREIKKGTGRFVSLFLIIVLGVAFYSGIRSCSPDMVLSADRLYDVTDLMDLRVMSTMGLTDDDIKAIEAVDGVSKTEGIYSYDSLCLLGEVRDAVKFRSVPEKMDRLKIQDGRQIQKNDECLMDAYFFDFYGYEMGDKIELLGNGDDDPEDIVENTSFTIVGTFSSPEYLSFDLGSTQVGSGKLNGLIMIRPDVFKADYYTMVDILVEGAGEEMAYSDAYDDVVKAVSDQLDGISAERELARYDEVKEEYRKNIEDAETELTDKSAELEDAKKQLADQKLMLEGAQIEADMEAAVFGFDNGLSQEVLDQVEDGRREIEEAEEDLKEAEEELADGWQKLEDSKKEMEELSEPEWYILDRKYLTEYTSFRSDAERIGNVGKVFPVIFFIVAALVCLTSMTRMVDEERTQIGTLKALGYGKAMIMRKYIVYALLATVSGSICGALAGGKVLPYVIVNVYMLMYPNLSELLFPYNLEHCLVASFAALICILAATFFACTKTLLDNPANLMRPVSPKPGRKLLLERSRSLWRRIPFTWKNALRNFVRYKKRLFMTLFGIVGSTALLLVGFGLKDSVNTIVFTQFGDIHMYDEIISFSDSDKEDYERLMEHVNSDDRFELYRFAYQSAIDVEAEGDSELINGYLFVPEKPDDFRSLLSLHDRVTQEPLELSDNGVLLSEKMARMLHVGKGDVILLSQDNGERKSVTVDGVVENYVFHYVYMTPSLYKTVYGESPDFNQIVIKNKEGVKIPEDELGAEYMDEDAASAVSSIDAMSDKFADKLKSLDSITLVLIICAGALTFVVLYNLNNINISERRRELATLKVLGFYDIELSGYIYRENILITILGIVIGLFAGLLLNSYIVNTVEVDIVMFGREIRNASYLFSILIAAGFTAVVNMIIHFKMKKIDMAASLKSVE